MCGLVTALLPGVAGAVQAHASGELVRGPVAVLEADTTESDLYLPLNASVVDSDGQTQAVWTRHGVLRTAQRSPDGVWSAPVTLDCAGATDVTANGCVRPSIGIDAAGSVTAAWMFGPSGSFNSGVGAEIHVARRTASGAWTQPVDLTTALGVTAGRRPRVLAAPTGPVAVLWEQGTGKYGMAPFTTYVAQISHPDEDWRQARLSILPRAVEAVASIAADGTLVVLAPPTQNAALRLFRYRPSTGWAPPVTIGNVGFSNAGLISGNVCYAVATAPSGETAMLWAQRGNASTLPIAIKARMLSPGGRLGRAREVLPIRFPTGTPDIALTVDGTGVFTAAWEVDYRAAPGHPTNYAILAARKVPGRPWNVRTAVDRNGWDVWALESNERGDLAIGYRRRVIIRPAGGQWSQSVRIFRRMPYVESMSLPLSLSLVPAATTPTARVLYDDNGSGAVGAKGWLMSRDVFMAP